MKLRRKLGKKLVDWGMRLYGDMPADQSITSVKTVLEQPLDAAVDASYEVQTWQPEQHGNVIIAEPELITLDRRGKFKL